MARHPIEAKVGAATAAAYVSAAGLLGVLAAVQDHARLLDPLPDRLSPLILAVIPGLLTFVSGWKARHTPRLGDRD